MEQSKQYIEGEGQWVGMVGGAIKAVYRRGGTVGGMVGGAIKAVYGRGWWVEQSKGGGGGWSNQSSI